ncbi:MAG: hypothetical protein IJO46_10670 [Thermoguttaceae bacterium]|nr:hypothetical protein [Clostridia bacterium]MBP3530946.1 hypothetical protein [Thermoguttaceae bacterium]MBQ6828465.1 hypothetical protein [Thermoguttaceae bacterium]
MPIQTLQEKYKKKDPRVALNSAIREEIPGGGALLQAFALASANQNASYEWGKIYKFLRQARDEATQEIAKRYELKSAQG